MVVGGGRVAVGEGEPGAGLGVDGGDPLARGPEPRLGGAPGAVQPGPNPLQPSCPTPGFLVPPFRRRRRGLFTGPGEGGLLPPAGDVQAGVLRGQGQAGVARRPARRRAGRRLEERIKAPAGAQVLQQDDPRGGVPAQDARGQPLPPCQRAQEAQRRPVRVAEGRAGVEALDHHRGRDGAGSEGRPGRVAGRGLTRQRSTVLRGPSRSTVTSSRATGRPRARGEPRPLLLSPSGEYASPCARQTSGLSTRTRGRLLRGDTKWRGVWDRPPPGV